MFEKLDGVSKSILLWGVICLFGFGLFQFWGTATLETIFGVWIVLAAIGIGAMFKWVKNAWKDSIVKVWTVLIVLGLALTIYYWLGSVYALQAHFGSTWLVVMGLGFAYTAWKTKSKVYWAAVGLHAVLLGLILSGVGFFSLYQTGLIGLVSGVPCIVDSLGLCSGK